MGWLQHYDGSDAVELHDLAEAAFYRPDGRGLQVSIKPVEWMTAEEKRETGN